MRSFGDERAKSFSQNGNFVINFIGVKRRLTVENDYAVCFFEIAFDAVTQNFGRKRVGNSDAAPTGFVFVSGTDSAQSRADFFIAESLFRSMIKRAVIRDKLMSARRNF